MIQEIEEMNALTVWSPGFKTILKIFSDKYNAIIREVLTTSNYNEKDYYANIKTMRTLRVIIKDIYRSANVEMPETVKITFQIEE